MLEKRIKIPIYKGWLTVAIDETLEKAAEPFDLGIDTSIYSALACNKTVGGVKEYAILLSKDSSVAAIAHESKHIVNMVFQHIGQDLDVKNDEAECYFLEWVFDQAYKAFLKYKK